MLTEQNKPAQTARGAPKGRADRLARPVPFGARACDLGGPIAAVRGDKQPCYSCTRRHRAASSSAAAWPKISKPAGDILPEVTSTVGTYRLPISLALSCPVLAPISVTRIGRCSNHPVHLLDLLRPNHAV